MADAEEDQLLAKVEVILQNEEVLSGQLLFDRSKKVLSKIQAWRSDQLDVYNSFKEKVETYFQKLNTIGTLDISVKGGKKAPLLLMMLACPVFLLGWLIHFLPAFFTKKLCGRLNPDPAWLPTFKILGGLIIYPLTLFLQYWLLSKCLSGFWEIGGWWKWAYLASIVPAGLVAEWFLEKWRLFRSNGNFRQFAKLQPTGKESLIQVRADILKSLHVSSD